MVRSLREFPVSSKESGARHDYGSHWEKLLLDPGRSYSLACSSKFYRELVQREKYPEYAGWLLCPLAGISRHEGMGRESPWDGKVNGPHYCKSLLAPNLDGLGLEGSS